MIFSKFSKPLLIKDRYPFKIPINPSKLQTGLPENPEKVFGSRKLNFPFA
jgi:hypothetical protein